VWFPASKAGILGFDPESPGPSGLEDGGVTLDIATLFVVTVFTLGVSGCLLLFTWLQNRETRALAWWGTTFLVFAPVTALFAGRGRIAEVWSIELANGLLLLGYGMMWTGARVFEGRATMLRTAAAGAAIWFLACRVPGFLASDAARLLLVTGVIWAYSFLFVRELWLSRKERLMSRWPVMAIVVAHAALFPVRVPAVLTMQRGFGSSSLSGFETLIVFAPLFYSFAIVCLLMALAKERAELSQREAATNDPLTGIANRRGFVERAQRIAARAAREGLPLTLLQFDLDNFKGVNDSFGHRMGDRVLALFADCASRTLRPLDLVGRLGGDEFVALLPGVPPEHAPQIAERVRRAFARAAREVDGCAVEATVSVGIASVARAPEGLDLLYSTADAALYRAKRRGRNRVELGRLVACDEVPLQPAQIIPAAG
jgi:diguanylate cyclase (GGDEF)-like protein